MPQPEAKGRSVMGEQLLADPMWYRFDAAHALKPLGDPAPSRQALYCSFGIVCLPRGRHMSYKSLFC